jgi:hypothetical protein
VDIARPQREHLVGLDRILDLYLQQAAHGRCDGGFTNFRALRYNMSNTAPFG